VVKGTGGLLTSKESFFERSFLFKRRSLLRYSLTAIVWLLPTIRQDIMFSKDYNESGRLLPVDTVSRSQNEPSIGDDWY